MVRNGTTVRPLNNDRTVAASKETYEVEVFVRLGDFENAISKFDRIIPRCAIF